MRQVQGSALPKDTAPVTTVMDQTMPARHNTTYYLTNCDPWSLLFYSDLCRAANNFRHERHLWEIGFYESLLEAMKCCKLGWSSHRTRADGLVETIVQGTGTRRQKKRATGMG